MHLLVDAIGLPANFEITEGQRHDLAPAPELIERCKPRCLRSSGDHQSMFGFQKLDVYRCAIEFVGLAVPLSETVPKGFAALGDQLRRASASIPLNIAEGSGKFDKDARRFYAIARGSALECAAIIDMLKALALIHPEPYDRLQALLDRIVAMLTKLIRD